MMINERAFDRCDNSPQIARGSFYLIQGFHLL